MGRRSQHTTDELRELILGATRRIVETNGFQALSAREIAREIGYAPGTLYNMFDDLDDILMRVQARVFEELDGRLTAAIGSSNGADAISRFARAYVEFAYEQPRLWQLVLQHHPGDASKPPEWYLDRLYAPMSRLEPIVGTMHSLTDADEAVRHARLLWSSLHGMLQVATTAKFGALPLATAMALTDQLVSQFCALGAGRPAPASNDRSRRQTSNKRERLAS